MIAKHNNEKLSLHRNQKRVVEYGSCLLSAINDAILLYTVAAIGPIPPAVEKKPRVKKIHAQSLLLFLHIPSSNVKLVLKCNQTRFSQLYRLNVVLDLLLDVWTTSLEAWSTPGSLPQEPYVSTARGT